MNLSCRRPVTVRFQALALAAAACLAPAGSAAASSLEDRIEERMLGAWVVIGTEIRSDCNGSFTNNRVNGTLVAGRGRRAFQPGELGKVERVDAKRSRLDLKITLAEPVLGPRQDGPFTLYDELRCQVELEIEMPREVMKEKDIAGIERRLAPVLARFATADEARDAKGWNQREREPYPADYERTRARHAAWKAEQVNLAVRASLERHREEAQRVVDRIRGDATYLAGFARGVEEGRERRDDGCESLISRNPRGSRSAAKDETPGQRQERQGWEDGWTLAVALDGLQRLAGCLVPVPDAP